MDGTIRDSFALTDSWNANYGWGSIGIAVANVQHAQSFTPQTAYQITSVWLPIVRPTSDNHGDLRIRVYLASPLDRSPVFSALVTGTVVNADIPVTGMYDFSWVHAEFDPVATISAGTEYAIVTDFPDSAVPYGWFTSMKWAGSISGGYPYGGVTSSYDGGITWIDWTGEAWWDWRDHFFKVGGADIGVIIPPSPLPPFPPDRPDDYDPDLPWKPGDWTPGPYTPPDWGDESTYVAAGGGRWGRQLVMVRKSLVFYEAVM
jgi:hypothetical protein